MKRSITFSAFLVLACLLAGPGAAFANTYDNVGDVSASDNSQAPGTTNTALGDGSRAGTLALATDSTAIGSQAMAIGNQSTAVGSGAMAGGVGIASATAVGRVATASANNASAYGIGSIASAANASAYGASSVATGEGSVAVGFLSFARGPGDVAIGLNARTTAHYSVAVGQNSLASGTESVALGESASAIATKSVALGAGSTTGVRDMTASVGAPGYERQITNVENATQPTDAVNLRQLRGGVEEAKFYTQLTAGEVNRQIRHDLRETQKGAYQGIAAVVALVGCAHTPREGKSTVNFGAGYYGSQAAVAASAAHRSRNGRFIYSGMIGVPVTMVDGANIAAGGGIGFDF